MCGITGIYNLNGEPVSTTVLKKMTDVISHRGPDGEGFWADGNIGFGHRRLAIIDLSPLGSQPMQTDDGNFIITYNGEVYNYLNIRIGLESKGYKFHSKTDTEVVLKAFQEYGPECVNMFNGMFAFAIWDCSKKRLFLARDRYGIKPLYYFYNESIFLFASEIKSLLKYPRFDVEISLEALNEYFTFQNIFSDRTLFKNVFLLPPATYLTIDVRKNNVFEKYKFWKCNFESQSDHLSENDYIEELIRLFKQAVNRQLVSDVEVGAYLSGGLDSGSISCLASQSFKDLKTFTCGFDLSSASGLELGFDERARAEYLSNKFKTEHYEVVLKAGDMERVMGNLIYHLEDLKVGQAYPNYYVARLASKFVKVVLSGAGGDELFAGYPWRYYSAIHSESFKNYIESYYDYWQRLIPDNLKPTFFNEDIYCFVKDFNTKDIFRSVLNGYSHKYESYENYINSALYFELKTFLHGILLVEDKLSMAHSLETRVPMLDNEFVDFALKVPVKFKLSHDNVNFRLNENQPPPEKQMYSGKTNNGKLILRKALSRFVHEDYSNGKKQGFSGPDASWFKGESIEYVKNLLFNKDARIYNYIQQKTAQNLMNEHFEGKVNRRLLIWSFLCFEWWLKIFKNE